MLFDVSRSILVRFSRRLACFSLLAASTLSISFGLAAANLALAADDAYLLQSSRQKDEITRVQTVIEVEGKLKINPDGKKQIDLPLKVTGNLNYDERLLEPAGEKQTAGKTEKLPARALRYYIDAKAEIKIGEGTQTPQLNENRRFIAVEQSAVEGLLFSPLGPLVRDELELIDVQASSLVVERLLPAKAVKVGDKWTHDNATISAVARIDGIGRGEATSTLKEVKGDEAFIELEGAIAGSTGGAATELGLRAKYTFNLKLKRITWFALGIQEERADTSSTPGLNVIARLRMQLTPGVESKMLSNQTIAQMNTKPSTGVTLLEHFSTAGGFSLWHDRRWNVMVDDRELTIFRLTDRGGLIGQCNVTRLPDDAKKAKSLEEFEEDVTKALGTRATELGKAVEVPNEGGVRLYRMSATGEVSKVRVQWIYYQAFDDAGHRASCIFTHELSQAEKFASADYAVATTLKFLTRPEPATTGPTPTPAPLTPAQVRPVETTQKPTGEKK